MAEDRDPKTLREVILEDYRGTVNYARDILKLLSSDDLLKKAASRVDVLNEAKQEIARSSQCLADTVKSKVVNVMGTYYKPVNVFSA